MVATLANQCQSPYRAVRLGAALGFAVLLVAPCPARECRTECHSVPQGVSDEVVLVRDGVARLPIVAGSVTEPVDELRRYLKEMSGAEFRLAESRDAAPGLYVGLHTDFPRLDVEDPKSLGAEGFLIRSRGGSLYLIGHGPLGVQHAVTTLLQRLGCRWFFAGETWEVVPQETTIAGSWDVRQEPAFATQRSVWPAYGQYPQNRRDWDEWNRHNRMGGPVPIVIHHTFNGLDPDRDFSEHADWFALVDGKRRPTKPCYSHPEVVRRAIEYALKRAESGEKMISMSAPDGLDFCECRRCRAVLQGGEPFEEHGTTWAKRPDGLLVNMTSETLFGLVNRVAAAVAEKHPDARIGCYAYSAYSHPPSFSMHPNVYIQVTTAFRRTPLTLEEQLAAWGRKTKELGVREYYSVYQWDWEEPYPGEVRPDRLVRDLSFFHENGVTAINAEASNNWGPRGLGYYLAAHLLWDLDADVPALAADFYQNAFGPAAEPMERYYVRWYGPGVAVPGAGESRAEGSDEVAGIDEKEPAAASKEQLRAAFADLDEAARLVRDRPGFQQRVDHLRMYLHYLCLRQRLREADARGDDPAVLAAIEAETVFGGRLNDTNMTHARPLIGKAFPRRFRKHRGLLATLPEALYVQSVSGLHSGTNPVSGDFSVGAEGLMVRDGALAEPVREVTIASTLPA